MGIRAIFMALLGGGASVFALWRPFAGMLFVVFIYFWRPDLWGAAAFIRPVEWATVGTALGWVIWERHKGIIPGAGWLLLFGAAYVLCTLAAPMADDASWQTVQDLTKILFFSFLILRLCDTPRRLSICAATILAGCLWVVKVVLLSWAAQGFSGEIRIDTDLAQGGGSNYIAWLLAATLPLLIYKVVRGQRWQRWGALAGTALWLASIVATGSRGGFLCTAVSVSVCLLMLRQGKAILLVGTLAGALALAAPARYWERINTITLKADEMDTSSLIRYQNVLVAGQIVRDYPVFGTGLNTFVKVKQRYVGSDYVGGDMVTHNTYLQMASELGIPFLAIFVVFNFWLLWRLMMLPKVVLETAGDELRWLRIWMVAAILATALQMGKGDMAKMDYLWWQYALALAILQVYGRTGTASAATGASTSAAGG